MRAGAGIPGRHPDRARDVDRLRRQPLGEAHRIRLAMVPVEGAAATVPQRRSRAGSRAPVRHRSQRRGEEGADRIRQDVLRRARPEHSGEATMGTVASDESGGREDGRKIFALFYGALVYVGVWCILLYIVGFVGNFFGPLLGTKLALVIPFKSIDMGIEEPLWKAVLVDVALVGILGLQHSIMPRPWFKAWITRFVPKHLERGTYIIFAICALSLLIWQWRPITIALWNVENPVLRVVLQLISVGGWITVLVATFQVGHWKIFGVT